MKTFSRCGLLSLAPGFSPVEWLSSMANRFNGFRPAKPLKRFCSLCRIDTGLKPGANECRSVSTPRGILPWLFVVAFALGAVCAFAQPTSTNTVRFHTVDVFVDSTNSALAAYQLEFTVTSGNAKIVGIEGGEHPVFADAPFYDPKAIQQERVILAAFSTQSADKLPAGKTRVATIHLQISGTNELKFETMLTTAATSDGNKIAATISATEKRAK